MQAGKVSDVATIAGSCVRQTMAVCHWTKQAFSKTCAYLNEWWVNACMNECMNELLNLIECTEGSEHGGCRRCSLLTAGRSKADGRWIVGPKIFQAISSALHHAIRLGTQIHECAATQHMAWNSNVLLYQIASQMYLLLPLCALAIIFTQSLVSPPQSNLWMVESTINHRLPANLHLVLSRPGFLTSDSFIGSLDCFFFQFVRFFQLFILLSCGWHLPLLQPQRPGAALNEYRGHGNTQQHFHSVLGSKPWPNSTKLSAQICSSFWSFWARDVEMLPI